MRSLLTITCLILTSIAFSQQNNNYLISYTDSSSGEKLIGFKERNGKIAIRAQYIFSYADTLYTKTMVLTYHGWYGIDRSGKHIIQPFIFDNGPDYFEEGLFRFVENNKIGFADSN